MVAAPEEPDLSVVFKWSPDVDANDAMLAMGALDLLVRHFDEVRAMQDLGERVDQIAIGAFDRGAVEARMAVGVRAEIEVVVAQPLELIEILK